VEASRDQAKDGVSAAVLWSSIAGAIVLGGCTLMALRKWRITEMEDVREEFEERAINIQQLAEEAGKLEGSAGEEAGNQSADEVHSTEVRATDEEIFTEIQPTDEELFTEVQPTD
jgi:hypothetical protein